MGESQEFWKSEKGIDISENNMNISSFVIM